MYYLDANIVYPMFAITKKRLDHFYNTGSSGEVRLKFGKSSYSRSSTSIRQPALRTQHNFRGIIGAGVMYYSLQP